MKPIQFTQRELRLVAVLAVLGFLIPNGIFLYFFISDPEVTKAALQSPISLVFIVEAFFLMLFFAWLLRKAVIRRPGAAGFILMSLLGSMAFSVPAALYLIFNNKKSQ